MWAKAAAVRQFPDKMGDAFVQAHVGEARVQLHAAQAAFEHAIGTWRQDDVVQAELASMAASPHVPAPRRL